MNEYESKQAGREAKIRERAESLRAEADRLRSEANAISDRIPFGQPILVGHHSERRHRRDLDRIDSLMRRAFAAVAEAESLERKAEGVGDGGISADDPDALAKLEAKIAELTARQERMKAANKVVRGKGSREDKLAALVALGESEGKAAELLDGDVCGNIGYPRFSLANNSGNLRRYKGRLEDMKRRSARTTADVRFSPPGPGSMAVEYREDTEANRVQLLFDGKPDADARSKLKSHGFRWAPSVKAWQRQLNANGTYAARQVLRKLGYTEVSQCSPN